MEASPITYDLWSVALASATDGWAVGYPGTILHWNGSAWTIMSSPTTNTLFSVAMISATDGWAVGINGVILRYGPAPTYSISGQVSDVNNNPISGVTVSDGAGHVATTGNDGNYTLSGLPAGTYTITPSKSGYTFRPLPQTVIVPPSVTGKDFKGYDKPPIVFVHGWNGAGLPLFCSQVEPNTYFQQADNDLQTAGYYVWYAYLESSSCNTPSLVDNVPNLKAAINHAKTITGQSKVILVSHSMGGLVSRAYIEDRSVHQNDVAALFTFGSPHLGVPFDVLTFFFNGLTLGTVCEDYQPAVCDFSVLGMTLFNQDHQKNDGVTYHVISGDAPQFTILPFWSRNAQGLATGALIPGPDDGIVPTGSGLGLSGNLATRWQTDELHGPGMEVFGSRTYFIRDGSQSTSYTQCLVKVLVQGQSSCGTTSGLELAPQTTSALAQHTPIEFGTLLPGQTATRTVPLEGGPALFASQWQTGTLAFTLRDPSNQVIDPAYAAANLTVVSYTVDANAATYYFPNATAGNWKMVLQATSLPAGGSAYSTFVAFDSNVALAGGTDKLWYAPGATATITATLTGSPLSATVTANILRADNVTDTVTLSPVGAGQYQAAYSVPNAPGYTEVRLVATGTTASSLPFERGTSLLFQISPNSFTLTNSYSDTPQPRSPGSSFYQALTVTVGINSVVSGTAGLSADLLDGNGNFVAHSLTIQDVVIGTTTLALRFAAEDIYASQRNGPYTLTHLLLTDQTGVTLVVAEADDVYTTAAYDYHRFGYLVFLPIVRR